MKNPNDPIRESNPRPSILPRSASTNCAMTPLILNHRISSRWLVNYTCRPLYPGKRNRHAFNGPHSLRGWFRRTEKFLVPTGIRTPARSARSLVTTPTLISLCIPFNWASLTKMRANEIWFSRRGEIKLISLGFHFCYKKNPFLGGRDTGKERSVARSTEIITGPFALPSELVRVLHCKMPDLKVWDNVIFLLICSI
jgi:hypothetical protein